MSTKALVVEDDPQVMDTIEDTLFSMGHEHLWVTNQQDARDALGRDHFHYVLLDLQIPAKPNRGGASKEFGINLLREISEHDATPRTPVIIMTAYISECLDMSTRLLSFGASEFIAKPFANKERSLAKVIHKVLRAQVARAVSPAGHSRSQSTGSFQPFAGGELVFFPSYAELLGVKIITSRGRGRSLPVLEQLAQTDSRGRFVRMSGEELAAAIGTMGGVNAITAAIQTLRRNISTRLRKLGIECTAEDVIAHDEQGYYLCDSIRVTEAAKEAIACGEESPQCKLNDRQRWALEQIRQGVPFRRVDLESKFKVAEKTAKRDLAELVAQQQIEFVRQGRDGFYRIPV